MAEHEHSTKKGGGGLRKKVGPLEVWQYLAIGGSLGFIYYLYTSKSKSKKEGLSPEEEEKLLGALRAGAGGSESVPGGIPSSPPTTTASVGEPGPPGTPGVAGAAAPVGEGVTQGELAATNAKIEALQNTKTGAGLTSATGAPAKKAAGERHITKKGPNGEVLHYTVHGSGRNAKVFQTPAEKSAAERAKKAAEAKRGRQRANPSVATRIIRPLHRPITLSPHL